MTFDDKERKLLEMPDEQLEFADWLYKRWMIYYNNNNGHVSQNDFARWLGIGNANLTNYMSGLRKPAAEFVEKLADKLGPAVYDKLDLPRKLPRDKMLLYIVDGWGDFSEQERRELLERARNMREGRERRGTGELPA